jgi:predicted DNA-binding antitoxin AbrB/MazE fold protein
MSQIIAAVFDKGVLHPEEPLELEEGTRVKITIKILSPAKMDKPQSFLQTARSLQLEGPSDWSENLDHGVAEQKYELPSRPHPNPLPKGEGTGF